MKWTSVVLVWMAVCVAGGRALAQNPIQWKSNARAAIEDARNQQLPLMFWVTARTEYLDDDDELRDAQERAFRDPIVVWLSRSRFVPVRVPISNSNVLKAAEEFGLPTAHGLYIAVMTPSGKVLTEINPGEVAEPSVLADRLKGAFDAFRADVYESQIKPVLADGEAPVPKIREAVQVVWRLNIRQADAQVIPLLDRPKLTPFQRGRLYTLLAALATKPCIDKLLADAPTQKDAMKALRGADPGALRFLVEELPKDDPAMASSKDPWPGLNDRQFAAYSAACAIAKAGEPRPKSFWEKSPAKSQVEVLGALRTRAEAVLAYWDEGEGKYR